MIHSSSFQHNECQRQAIEHPNAHLLISAGPGTGKTHTLTHRIAFIAARNNAIKNILAITFTQKAAAEMKSRLKTLLGDQAEQITIGTFHAFCHQVLLKYQSQTALPKDFSIATPSQIEEITGQLWPQWGRRQRAEHCHKIAKSKSGIGGCENLKETKLYNLFLRERKLIDFDDLLQETVLLLERNPSVRKEIRQTHRFIFVDEYQDINPVQRQLLKMLVSPSTYLTAIGDPHQAIYGFRGSDARVFDSFKEDFSDATVMTLNENYRSGQNILTASRQMLSKKSEGTVPELIARIYSEGHLIVHSTASDKAEAEYVVYRIEQLIGGISHFSRDSGRTDNSENQEYTFGDIAILFRLHAQKKILLEALRRSGIPATECFGFLDQPTDREESYRDKKETVSLLTLHAVKGCEFPVVFIVGCEDGLLPLHLEDMEGDPIEERRLFYVGMTRAKERLYLTHARRRFVFGQRLENPVSPFVDDIQENLKTMERLQQSRKADKIKKIESQMSLFE